MTASRGHGNDFSSSQMNSRRRRRLKKPGAPAPGFTGVWGRLATNKRAPGIYRCIACYNGEGAERGGNPRTVQRQLPKLQWEGTGLTAHCLSCHARYGKLSAGPPIAAFDLRRLKGGNTPRIRVTQQAESVVGCGGRRLKPFTIWKACKWDMKSLLLSGSTYQRGKAWLLCADQEARLCWLRSR